MAVAVPESLVVEEAVAALVSLAAVEVVAELGCCLVAVGPG